MTPDIHPCTVRCGDCDWSVAAPNEAAAWRKLAAHRAKAHDDETER